jgi:ADP-heptose:LPS heptosyltransferase
MSRVPAGAHFAVFRPGPTGDFVLHTGLFNAIKDQDPGARLTVITGSRARLIAEHHPAIDRVLLLDMNPLGLWRLARGLRERPIDVWIDPKGHPSRTSAIAARLAPAGIKVGFRGRFGPFDLFNPQDDFEHVALAALRPLGLLGLPMPAVPRLSLGIPPQSKARAEEVWRTARPFTVLVNNAAAAASRAWPDSHWAEGLRRMAALRPTTFLVNAPEAQRQQGVSLMEAARASGVDDIRLLPAGNILDAAAMLERADLVVTVDTSLVHLAAVFDRPIVALYFTDSWNMDRFHPLSTVQEAVLPDPPGAIANITVDAVEAAYRRVLARITGSGAPD